MVMGYAVGPSDEEIVLLDGTRCEAK